MMKAGILLLFLFSFVMTVYSQKYILIEKAGSPRTERIAMYEELTFQLVGDDVGWYTRQVLDMDAAGQLILLGDSWTSLKDISRIRLKRQRAIANILGGALQGGGVSMMLGDIWYTIRGHSAYTQGGIEFGLVNIAVGTLIRGLWAPIKYRLGKTRRLRVVDLTF